MHTQQKKAQHLVTFHKRKLNKVEEEQGGTSGRKGHKEEKGAWLSNNNMNNKKKKVLSFVSLCAVFPLQHKTKNSDCLCVVVLLLCCCCAVVFFL